MKTNFAILVGISMFAASAFGQQSSDSPTPESLRTPPRRYSPAEMSRFRTLRTSGGNTKSATAEPHASSGIQMTLGDSASGQDAGASARSAIQTTSYVTGEPVANSVLTGPVQSSTQESTPVPEILSGVKPSTAPSRSPSSLVPTELSMNQSPARSDSAPSTVSRLPASAPRASSSASASSGAAQAPTSTTTKIQTKPKSEVFSLAPTMPSPGQPAIDLRKSAAPTYQASRPMAQPGRVMTVSAKQESVESLNNDSSTTNTASSLPQLSAASSTSNTPAAQASTSATTTASGTPTIAQPVSAAPQSTTSNMMRAGTTNLGGAKNSSRPSAAQDANLTTINTPGAAIEVSTTGPKSISVGKNASYGIEVSNVGRSAAQQLAVSFSVPTWIELSNTNLTTGAKEIVRETDATRILWRIDRLEAGKSQRLSLDVIPRKAQVFDLNVEWSVAPLSGAVQVQVTEPLVKMAITGPDEVQFGQSALYNVSIRNPGTGVAENVNVMLSEVLGGERASLGNLGPGEEKNIQVELIARSAGALDLAASVSGDGNLQDAASKKITVRRAQIDISLAGPATKYAGSNANYQITVENSGDAIAQDVYAAIGLPSGVQYLSGVEAAEKIEGGMRWAVGALPPGGKRTYTIACQLNTAGSIQLEAGARGAGDLADADTIQTNVETVADLVLTVEDPQGPLPIGQDVNYKIVVRNRGSKTATNLDLVMHFSNGIEPTSAEGRDHKINPGEVAFDTIGQLDPNEEMVFHVTARASIPGAHMFRAQLICAEADAREVAQGTTKFVGEDAAAEVNTPSAQPNVGQMPLTNGIR